MVNSSCRQVFFMYENKEIQLMREFVDVNLAAGRIFNGEMQINDCKLDQFDQIRRESRLI